MNDMTLEDWYKVRDERDSLVQQNQSFERSQALAMSESEMLRQQIKDLEQKSSFYMRHSTELVTNLSNILDIVTVAEAAAGKFISGAIGLPAVTEIIKTALQRAKDAAYRPTNAAPARQQPRVAGDDGEPSPTFLHKNTNELVERLQTTNTTDGHPGAPAKVKNKNNVGA